jgi:hypothetical protein
VSPPRQGVLLWELQQTQPMPEATQQLCRELLSHMLLAAVNTTSTNPEEESNEQKDSAGSH